MLVRPSRQLKQIIQSKHSIVKNPSGLEANQLAIYKRGRPSELGATEIQIQVEVRAGLEPGTAGLRVRHADHSATLPPVWFVLAYWIEMVILSASVVLKPLVKVTIVYVV